MPDPVPGDLPIVADFAIPALPGLVFRDRRDAPEADMVAAVEMGEALTRQLMSDDRAGEGLLLCSDDSMQHDDVEFRHQASLDAKAAGQPSDFVSLDAIGATVRNDYVGDARFQDQTFLIYEASTLIGSFVILRLRFRSPNTAGNRRAIGTPWPRLLGWNGMTIAELWPPMMNYIMDTNLPFDGSPGKLDIVEWKFPVSVPAASFFRHNDVDTHGANGMGAIMRAGRDEIKSGELTHYLRRRGERWSVEP